MIIGTLGSSARVRVSAGGVLHLPSGVDLAWWIGADDRWHVPAEEITVRQSLVADAPVPRIAVRVPGGDVVTTLAAVQQAQRELVVIDIANQSAVPVAVGFIITVSGDRVITVDGATVRVDGTPVLYLPRAPRFAVGVAAGADLRQALQAGESGAIEAGAAQVAVMLPVTHRTTLRAAALLGAASVTALAASPVLSALPDGDAVARGWAIQAGRVPSVDGHDIWDSRLRSLGAAVLLEADAFAPGDADVDLIRLCALSRACDRVGLHTEAGTMLEVLDGFQGRRGAMGDESQPLITALAVAALADHATLTSDGTFASGMAPLVAGALEFLHKRGPATDRSVFGAAARLFTLAGEDRAARTAIKVWTEAGLQWPLMRTPLPPVPAVSDGASLLPDDLIRLSDAVLDAAAGIALEDSDGVVDLLGGMRADDLLGVNLAVHRSPTVHGSLSFALRWHGARAALLWEFTSGAGGPLRVPSLASGHVVAGQRTGEVLLNPA